MASDDITIALEDLNLHCTDHAPDPDCEGCRTQLAGMVFLDGHQPTCRSHRCGWEWRSENGAGACRQPRDSEIHYVGTVDSHAFVEQSCDCGRDRRNETALAPSVRAGEGEPEKEQGDR